MEKKRMTAVLAAVLALGMVLVSTMGWSQQQASPQARAPHDAVLDAQTPREVPITRPEQVKNQHDRSELFSGTAAEPSSTAFVEQPDQGKILGFDFFRDPLDAKKPMMTLGEIYQEDAAGKKQVMEKQRRLLETRYNLKPNLSPDVKMSRGKPI